MPRPRISLASLLGIIAVIALGLAGMMSASSVWTTAAATVTLALLLTALLGARLLDGIDRAFWAGFALFGWTYLLLVNWDWVGGQFGHDLTAGLSDVADSIFADVTVPGPARPPASGFTTQPPSRPDIEYVELVRQRQIKIGNFVQIGRMFLSLVFGLSGGFISMTFARRRESAAKPPDRAPSGSRGHGAG
jgi:hypothetical protein